MNENKNTKSDIFYCYSKRLKLFIQSYGINYIDKGLNKNTQTIYWTFNKSENLDKIISLYNEVKHNLVDIRR